MAAASALLVADAGFWRAAGKQRVWLVVAVGAVAPGVVVALWAKAPVMAALRAARTTMRNSVAA